MKKRGKDVVQINKPSKSTDIGSRSTTLCDLPDDVLRRILSLLPARDAVRMGMASKKFESLWRSVPKLEFHLSCYHTRKERRLRRLFMDFVERTLQLHDGSPITEFSLSCWEGCDVSRISKWIVDVVVQHNVQDLALYLYPTSSLYDSPSCVFRGEGLRKLYLEGSATLWVLGQIHLPNLKDLTFECVCFGDPKSTEKFLSSPSLERLSLNSCSFALILKPITISAPMLNTVCLGSYRTREIRDHLAIHAPNLKHIVYRGELARRLMILGSPLLDDIVIRPCGSSLVAEEWVSNNLHMLLQDISSVKNELTLSSILLRQLKGLEDPFTFIPVFSNLRNLKLTGRNDFFFDAEPDSDVLCPLLRRCPSIETLQFHRDLRLREEPRERHQNLFLPNLKKITIDGFTGSTAELLTIKFLLARAPALEKLVLTYFSSLSEKPNHLDKLFFSMLLEFPGIEFRVV